MVARALNLHSMLSTVNIDLLRYSVEENSINGNFYIFSDFLRLNFKKQFNRKLVCNQRTKIRSNIPYYGSTIPKRTDFGNCSNKIFTRIHVKTAGNGKITSVYSYG